MADIPLYVVSDYSASERRVTPSWTVGQFKSKMESVTGIPPSQQRLEYRSAGGDRVNMEVGDEEVTVLSQFPLAKGGEIHVSLLILPFERAVLICFMRVCMGISIPKRTVVMECDESPALWTYLTLTRHGSHTTPVSRHLYS